MCFPRSSTRYPVTTEDYWEPDGTFPMHVNRSDRDAVTLAYRSGSF